MTEDDNTNDEDEDEDACDERRLSDGYAYSSRYAHRRSSGQYRRDNRYSYPHSYTQTYTCYSHTPSTLAEYSSSPTSCDSEATVFSEEPFGDKEKQGWSGVLRRKRKDKGKEKEKEETRDEDEYPEQCTPTLIPLAPMSDPVVNKEEYVPTCNEIFQRHWQTLCLAFNLSVFRAQRRMKHRVHSLMSTN